MVYRSIQGHGVTHAWCTGTPQAFRTLNKGFPRVRLLKSSVGQSIARHALQPHAGLAAQAARSKYESAVSSGGMKAVLHGARQQTLKQDSRK